MNRRRGQAILEYFLILGVLVVIAVVGSVAFRTKIQDKVAKYRDAQAERITMGVAATGVAADVDGTASSPATSDNPLLTTWLNYSAHVVAGDPNAIQNGVADLILTMTGDSPETKILVGIATGSPDTVVSGVMESITGEENSTAEEVVEWVTNPIGKAADTIAGWFGW